MKTKKTACNFSRNEERAGYFNFTSPIAKRYYSSWIFSDRLRDCPSSMDDLVLMVIQNMPASLLQGSRLHGHNLPKKGIFQHLFMEGLAKNTPPKVFICPELSVFKDDPTTSTSKKKY